MRKLRIEIKNFEEYEKNMSKFVECRDEIQSERRHQVWQLYNCVIFGRQLTAWVGNIKFWSTEFQSAPHWLNGWGFTFGKYDPIVHNIYFIFTMLSRLSEIFYLINCVAIDSIQKFDSVQTLDSIQTIGSILTIDSIQTFDSILTIDSIQTFDRIQTIDSIQTLNSIQSSCQDKPGENYDKSIES